MTVISVLLMMTLGNGRKISQRLLLGPIIYPEMPMKTTRT
jgi:hypothetical protein